jgi:hypothetical protein
MLGRRGSTRCLLLFDIVRRSLDVGDDALQSLDLPQRLDAAGLLDFLRDHLNHTTNETLDLLAIASPPLGRPLGDDKRELPDRGGYFLGLCLRKGSVQPWPE